MHKESLNTHKLNFLPWWEVGASSYFLRLRIQTDRKLRDGEISTSEHKNELVHMFPIHTPMHLILYLYLEQGHNYLHQTAMQTKEYS